MMKKLMLIAVLSLFLAGCGGSASDQKSEDESIVLTVQSPISNTLYDKEPNATYEVTEDDKKIPDAKTQKFLNDVELNGFQSGDTLPAVEGFNEFTIEFKNVSVVIPFDLTAPDDVCQGHAHRKGKGHLRHDCDSEK